MAPPTVALITPFYHAVPPQWADTVYRATRPGSDTRVKTIRCFGSLLDTTFNNGFAAALTLRDRGEATHVAMAHSDIEAEPGWLDVLLGELAATGAGLVSAVVAIKGPEDRTSTAVGDRADRWKVNRFLRLADRPALPATFGPEHVCGPDEVLLVNTGLWAADLTHPAWDHFLACGAFNTHSRIVRSPDGYKVASRSEDYEMSRDLQAAGMRVVATWKVRVGHVGNVTFPNYES